MSKKLLILLFALFQHQILVYSQFTIATDNATNYSTFGNGSTGGTGFGAWSITYGSNTGTYLGNPADNGIGTANIGTKVFSFYSTGTEYLNAERTMPELEFGDELSFYWGMNWDAYTGSKGFTFYNGSSELFYVTNGGSATISCTNGTVQTDYGTTPMLVKLKRTTGNAYSFLLGSRSGGSDYTTTFSNALNIDKIKIYTGNQQNGSGERNIHFNVFQITNSGVFDVGSGVTESYTKSLSGNSTLTKSGLGTLLLSGTNSYTGQTYINAGTLKLGNSSALGTTASSGTTVSSGAVLDLNGINYTTTSETITLSGTGISNGGAIINSSATDAAFSSAISLSANSSVGGSGNLSLNGIISGASRTLTKVGAGILTLGAANTYTGSTTISEGTLKLGASERIHNSSNLILGGGTLSTNGYTETIGTLQLTENSTIALGAGSHSLTFSESKSVSWTSGKTLTITEWAGSANSTGTAGKIFVGSTTLSLTKNQLAQITFQGYSSGARLLTTGELVPATPAIIYVNDDATGANSGVDWTNAFTSLQTALDFAISGDQIWVAKGTYKPSTKYDLPNTGNRYFHFRMINDVAIYGGFSGTETAINQRTDYGLGGVNETILSGDIGTVGDASDNCYSVFYHPSGWGLTNSAILDGFTITDGNGNYAFSGTGNKGGGMINYNNSPTLSNIIFSNNYSKDGGAVYNTSDSGPLFNNCLFFNNSATNGAAIYNYSSNVLIQFLNTKFINNNSTTNGGAIYNHTSNITLTNCLTSNNTASSGGGIYNYGGTFTLTNSTFANNSVTGSGGAIYNMNAGTGTINNSILWGNTATTSGNLVAMVNGTITLNYTCYQNGTGDISGNTFVATNNNTTTNPMFVNASGGDFRLYGLSPCTDTGNDSYCTETTDIRGTGFGRKLSKWDFNETGTIDRGAYEYNGNTDPAGPYMRTFQEGNWGDATTWQSSPNGTDSWSAATRAPISDGINVNILYTHPVTITSNASASAINIEAGGKLTLNDGATLRATSFHIGSSEEQGTGSFVDKNENGGLTVTGNSSVEQYLKAGRNWYLSSPITNATTSALSTASSIAYWDESIINDWVTFDTESPLLPGNGYISVNTANDGNITFSGTLNSDTIPVAVTSTIGKTYRGFNLIGNPYPSHYAWTEATATAGNVLPTIWYRTAEWDAQQEKFVYAFHTYNAPTGLGVPSSTTGYIPPMQAFWVKANEGGGTVNFANSQRFHSSHILKAPSDKNADNKILRLTITLNDGTDETLIHFNANAIDGFDKYDSPKMINTDENALIYSLIGTQKMVINGMNAMGDQKTIPIGLKTGSETGFKVQATEITGFENGTQIILKNNITNERHNLADGTLYDFVAPESGNEEAFSLILLAPGISTAYQSDNISDVVVFANNHRQIVISTVKNNSENLNISVFNSVGQCIAKQITKNTRQLIDVSAPGVYLVKVNNHTEKVVVK